MLKIFVFAIALFSGPVLLAQDVFQPAIQAPAADVGRYNAKGERLSTRSPSHVLANADKTHFTLSEWAQRILDEKRKPEQMKAANAFIELVDKKIYIKSHTQDIDELKLAVRTLFNSGNEIGQATAVDLVYHQFRRGEFNDILIIASKSESTQVKWRAFRALSRSADIRGVIPVYETTLLDRKEQNVVKKWAAYGLARKLNFESDESALEPLQKGLKANKDPEIRKIIEDSLREHYARTN